MQYAACLVQWMQACKAYEAKQGMAIAVVVVVALREAIKSG